MINLLRKKRFHYYHKLLWNGIIKELEKKPNNNSSGCTGSKIKLKVYDQLFSLRVHDFCFGCEIAKRNKKYQYGKLCVYCMFDIKKMNGCLDGNWRAYCLECYVVNWQEAIKYATLIRDFPVKKEFQ